MLLLLAPSPGRGGSVVRVKRVVRWMWTRWKLHRGRCTECHAVLRDDDPLRGVCSVECDEQRKDMAAW